MLLISSIANVCHCHVRITRCIAFMKLSILVQSICPLPVLVQILAGGIGKPMLPGTVNRLPPHSVVSAHSVLCPHWIQSNSGWGLGESAFSSSWATSKTPRRRKRPKVDENEGGEMRTPNLLIWSQTRCHCAMPPLPQLVSFALLSNWIPFSICDLQMWHKQQTRKQW